MPEIGRFYGIVIRMYFADHNPPHFHAHYRDSEALVRIDTLEVIAGNLPGRALRLVSEWGRLHHEELTGCWDRARNLEPLGEIDPLP